MGSRKKQPVPQQPVSAAQVETESRNSRAVAVFMLLASCLLLAGANFSRQDGVNRTLGIVVGTLYLCAGIGGLVGWIAALRGSRRWSRAIYLQALGVPVGTILAFIGHGIRWGCLNPGLKFASHQSGHPQASFEVGFWSPRISATLWVLALAILAAIPFAAEQEWSKFGNLLLAVPIAALWFLTSSVAPFSGHSCSVAGSGLNVGGDREITWKEMTGTLYLPIPRYRLIWVRTGGMVPSTIIPLFLKDFAGFARAVRKHAPDNHPLRSRLERLRPTS
jgi:hypothetical protein